MYPTIAAYEIMAQANTTQYKSLAEQLNGFGEAPKITEKANPELTTIYAYNIIGKSLIFSEDKMEAYQEKLDQKIKDMGVPRSVRKASMVYAQSMADHILQWASKDMLANQNLPEVYHLRRRKVLETTRRLYGWY